MKRIISILLAVVIAISAAVVSFAKSSVITAGTAVTANVKEGDSADYVFTSPETAVYKLTLKALTKTFSEIMLNCDEDEYSGGYSRTVEYDNYNTENTFTEYFAAHKGSSYTLSVINNSDIYNKIEKKELGLSSTASIELKITKTTVPEVKLGGKYTVSAHSSDGIFTDDVYYFMKPAKSGYYNFRTQDISDSVIPEIAVFSDTLNGEYSDGFASADEIAIDFTTYMEAGRLYLIDISAFTLDDEEGKPFDVKFTLTVNDGNNIPAEEIYAESPKISMARNDVEFNSCVIYPSGATPFKEEDITITSSNPKVADVTFYEVSGNYISMDIDSFRFFGKTTITVDLPNGLSTEFKVYVKPRIILFIENIFSFLFG